VPPGPGNADFWHEGLARIGDSNGDCTDEKRLERELVLACTHEHPEQHGCWRLELTAGSYALWLAVETRRYHGFPRAKNSKSLKAFCEEIKQQEAKIPDRVQNNAARA